MCDCFSSWPPVFRDCRFTGYEPNIQDIDESETEIDDSYLEIYLKEEN